MTNSSSFTERIRANRERFLFFLRYALTGIGGGAIQTLFLYIWVSLLGLRGLYLVGLCLGFILALIATFLLQKYWTFRDRALSRVPRQLVSYSAVAVSGLVLNAALLALAKAGFDWARLDFFGGWYILVQIICIGIVALVNLCMNYVFTFRHARKERLWERP